MKVASCYLLALGALIGIPGCDLVQTSQKGAAALPVLDIMKTKLASEASASATSDRKSVATPTPGPILASASLALVDQAALAIGNTAIYPKPPAPSLPPAGGSYRDPIFGTTIYRVTDERDGLSAQALYSYLCPFNKDSSRFVASIAMQRAWGIQNVMHLYTFDPGTDAFVKVGPLWGNQILQGSILWSADDPYSLFSTETTRLYRYQVETRTYTMLKDFNSLCPSTQCTAWQLSKSSDDRFFAFHLIDNTQNATVQAVAWDSRDDKTYRLDIPSNFTYFDETHLDSSGRWLFVRGQPASLAWEFATDTLQTLPFIGHYDVGPAFIVGVGVTGPAAPGYRKTTLGDLANSYDVFYYPKKEKRQSWQNDSHISIHASDPTYAFITSESGIKLKGWARYTGAIYQVTGASKAASGVAFPPDVMRHNGRDLKRVEAMPVAPGQWYVDTASDSYLVWPYAAADLTATAKNLVTVLDWFPAMDEIVQLWTDGSLRFRRLAHHRSGVWNYESAPRGSIDRSGRYFIYTSNWDGMTNPDGSPRTDVFILRVPLEITGVLKP